MKNKNNFLLTILLLCFHIYFVQAQSENLKFQHIGVPQGLSQSSVASILQDKEGFMWFGTRDGLNKYDGYKFTIFKNNPDNPSSISNNHIRKIIEDEDNIWIATWGGGLNKFDKETEIFTSYKNNKSDLNSLSNDFVHTAVDDHSGHLWIGTDAGGVNLFDKKSKKFTSFQNDPNDSSSLSDNEVLVVAQDKNRNIWVGTKNGLNLYNAENKSFQRFFFNSTSENGGDKTFIRSIYEDNRGNFWVGSFGEGLLRLDRKKNILVQEIKILGSPDGVSSSSIFSIGEDDEGNILIGTENGGLAIYNPQTKEKEQYIHDQIDPYSICDNSIHSVYKDGKGNLWIGTYNKGVSFINSDLKTKHYRKTSSENSLSNNIVLTIYEGSNKNLWISTDGGGLNLLDKRTGLFSHFKHDPQNPNSICGNYVLTVVEDVYGYIWVGTWGNGITVFHPGKKSYKHFKNDPSNLKSLNNNNIWKIFQDSKSNIWIGTYGGGLELYDRKTDSFIHFSHDPSNENSVPYNNIHNIYEDKSGKLWITTDGGGVSLFDLDAGIFRNYKHDRYKNSISHSSVNCVLEDKKGIIWLGTNDGLNSYDKKADRFKNYKIKDGLPNEVVWGILEDSLGNLWISTNNGLSKFNSQTEKFTNFTTASGLQSNEFNRHAFCKSSDGLMYFGGKNGFNEIDPNQFTTEPFAPPLVLTDFQIFNKSVPIGPNSILKKHISKTKEIVVPYEQSVLSFQFASLNYTFPEKRHYSYKLEGFDKNWNDVGSIRTATYTNLNPGFYTFRVRGMNTNSVWSEKEIALKINITPPFWMTWWFRSILFLSIGSAFFAFYFVRINIIKKQKEKLERQVLERTAEVVQQKEEIITQGKRLEVAYSDIQESIRAAEEIQKTILPSEEFVKSYLPESFILFKPKDVVSGDFYWFDMIDGQLVIAAADCTGHGVSGALMSINGYHLLNKSIYYNQELVASEILDRLNQSVIREMNQKHEDLSATDGMDISLCIVSRDKKTIQYAGANHPLYVLRDEEIIQLKPNRYSIGLSIDGKVNKFTNHVLDIQSGDSFYLFSDGFADQLGGTSGMEKFMYPRFRALIGKISSQSMKGQVKAMDTAFLEWSSGRKQLDDVLVIGFKL